MYDNKVEVLLAETSFCHSYGLNRLNLQKLGLNHRIPKGTILKSVHCTNFRSISQLTCKTGTKLQHFRCKIHLS